MTASNLVEVRANATIEDQFSGMLREIERREGLRRLKEGLTK